MNEQSIRIDNIPFSITESLGSKGLITNHPAFGPVNTFIGLLHNPEFSSAVADAIQQQKDFSVQGFAMYKTSGNDREKGLAFWRQMSNTTIQEPLYALIQEWNPTPCYIPHTTLVNIAVCEEQLKKESRVIDYIWLFRPEPLAEYPNLNSNLLVSEKAMVIQLEAQLDLYHINDEGKLLEKGTGTVLSEDSPIMQELNNYGLLSPKQKAMKLYWLEQWQCANLIRFYSRQPDHPAPTKAIAMLNSSITPSVLEQFERQITELSRLTGTSEDEQATAAAKRRFLFLDLEYYGLFDFSTSTAWLEFLTSQSYPALLAYYRHIVSLITYYQSDERQQLLGELLTDRLMELPFALEWFRHNKEPNFAWMAAIEKIFLKAQLTTPGMIFSRLNDRRIRLDVAREDGIHLRIMKASFQ